MGERKVTTINTTGENVTEYPPLIVHMCRVYFRKLEGGTNGIYEKSWGGGGGQHENTCDCI